MAGKDGPAQAGPGAANGNLGHNAAPDWYRDARANVWLPYTQMQNAPALPVVTHADGVHLTLADGRRLVDGIASWWTACHGYNHPHIVAAVESQNRAMQHVMFAGLAHEPAYRLASRLAALLPGDLNHVFFSESGSVSVEVALKIALQYWRNKGFTGRTRFLCFRGGYHGDTMATMAVTDPENPFHAAFRGAAARAGRCKCPGKRCRLRCVRPLARGPSRGIGCRHRRTACAGGGRHEDAFA